MKHNDIKNALSEIKPDIYMKARLEAKVSEKTTPKRHRLALKTGIATALCVAIAAVSIGVGEFTMKTNTIVPSTTQQTQNETATASKVAPGFVMIAYADENKNIIKRELIGRNFETTAPVKYQISTQNIKGMSEADIEKAVNVDNWVESIDMSNAHSGNFCGERLDNAIVKIIQLDYFDLDLEEYDDVAKISVSNQGAFGEVEIESFDAFFDENGNFYEGKKHDEAYKNVLIRGNKVEIDGKRYIRCRDENYNFSINWKPAQKLYDEINDNPDMDLSIVTDTLTFEVEFNDGSVSKSVIDIGFDSDGNMFATPKAFDYIK